MQERRRRRAPGFTLVEMLVVVMIMALIATAVGLGVMHVWEQAQVDQTRNDAMSLMSAADVFLLQSGGDACPTIDDLALDQRRRSTDAWDRPFRVDCEDIGIVVRSAGPDGLWDNEDDVTSVAQ